MTTTRAFRQNCGSWAVFVVWLVCRAGLVHSAGTNLLVNGNFESTDLADANRLPGWDPPDGVGIVWVDAADADGITMPTVPGRIIRMDTRVSERDMVDRWTAMDFQKWIFPEPAPGPIAATYGLRLESERFSVVSGMTYRVSCDVFAPGNGAKVWVRGYADVEGREVRRYETVVHVRSPPNTWVRETRTFNPTRHRPDVVWMRVMLFAYWPPGVYAFDNVRIEPVDDDITRTQ